MSTVLPSDFVAIYRKGDDGVHALMCAFSASDEAALDAARVVAERLRWSEGDEFIALCLNDATRRFSEERWNTVTGGDPLPRAIWSPDLGWHMQPLDAGPPVLRLAA